MKRALVIIDVQNDFLPNGALAVPNGHEVIPVINSIMNKFDLVIATQDWHPRNHKSFASNNFGKAPFEMGELGGKPQMMWPDHCIQGTVGAELSAHLDQANISIIVRKGMDPEVDSYSGFMDNGFLNHTGLEDLLLGRFCNEVYFCGLATDYCVKHTALDAKDLFPKTEEIKVSVITDACRGIVDGNSINALKEMEDYGVVIIKSEEIA